MDFQDPELQALIESLPDAPATARLQCLEACGLLDDLSYDFDDCDD